MAKYCIEKFENENGAEKKVYWRQDKHIHNAAFITTLKQWLGGQFGGTWDVRANSYESNQSSAPTGNNVVEYTG